VATICLAERPDSGLPIATIRRELAGTGHHVINESDLADGRADCLLYVCSPPFDPELLRHWLSLVNRVEVDVLVAHGSDYSLPADMIVPLGPNPDELNVGAFVASVNANIEDRLTLTSPAHRMPRLILSAYPNSGPYVSTAPDQLYELLQNGANRVLAVAPELLRGLRNLPLKTRRDYDLARFIKWSQDRLDTAYVKLSLRLAGGEATSSAVTRRETSLVDIISDHRSSELVVLKGPPGAGKSLQLRHLETYQALDSIRRGSPDDYPMAFCVALGEHAVADTETPMDWLRSRWAQRVQVERFQTLDVRLRRGNIVLLLDGFNEIPFGNSEDRRRWMLRWRSAVHHDLLADSNNRVVVACRSRDLNVALGSDETPQTTVEMAPLTHDELIGIAQRRNPTAAVQLQNAIDVDPSLITLYSTPFSLTDYLDHATTAPGVPRSQSEIFCRRIASALGRERRRQNFRIFDSRWLPDDIVSRILELPTSTGITPLLRSMPLMAALGQLAHQLTAPAHGDTLSRHSAAIAFDECLSQLQSYLSLDNVSEAQDALYAAVDLDLLTLNEGVVRFQHQTLQEFFTATLLDDDRLLAAIELKPGDFELKLGLLSSVIEELSPGDELQVVPSTGFEEVFARAAELRPDLVDRCIDQNPWLASERIMNVSPTQTGSNSRRDAAMRELRHRATEASDVRERIGSLLALAELGWRPDWLVATESRSLATTADVPGGTWRLGCSERMASVIGSSRPPRTVELAPFRIGRFAVTNVEYESFIVDGGYQETRYWSVEGWLWRTGAYPLDQVYERWLRRRDVVVGKGDLALDLLHAGRVSITEAAAILRFAQMSDDEVRSIAETLVGRTIDGPAFARDARFANPLQPVIGVSPYEAEAYCRWLSARSGHQIRLPTEDEWEAAAIYSWLGHDGTLDEIAMPEQWSPTFGNTAELHLNRPSPVGAFSDRASLDGVRAAEFSGNVFEWVLDSFRPGEEWRRVCRGGSWRHLIRRAHPAYRGRGDLTTRNDDDGFRIAATKLR